MVGNRSAIRKSFPQKVAVAVLSLVAVLVWAALWALPFTVPLTSAIPRRTDCAAIAASGQSSYVVMERTSRRVLKESNMDLRLPMASTTKVMTALVALENGNLSDIVTVPECAVGVEGSSIYLKKGEKFTLEELLYGLMLRSGNDAAVAVAVHISGSVDEFVKLMNRKAEALGLNNTSFVNPHGLSAKDHYTSAYDLAVIASAALGNENFKKIVSTKNITVQGNEDRETRYFANKNKILYNYEGATGIKTGYTVEAGRCLAASSEKEGMEVVAVALNYYDYFRLCSDLMDFAHENYRMERVVSPEFVYKTVSVSGNRKVKSAELKTDCARYYPLKKDGSESVESVVEAPDGITAPHSAKDAVGTLRVFMDKRLLFEEKLYTIDIEKKGLFSFFGK